VREWRKTAPFSIAPLLLNKPIEVVFERALKTVVLWIVGLN